MAKATNEHIGQMRERIAIERFTASQNATGEETGSWATLSTVWTAVKYNLTGSDEEQLSEKKTAITSTVFRIRYNTSVIQKDRILYRSEYFDILSITHDPGRVYTTLEAKLRE